MAYSRLPVVYDGTTDEFAVAFAGGVLSRNDVTAYKSGEVDGQGTQIYRDITWINDGLVRVDVSGLVAGDIIVLERTTEKVQPVHDYADGANLIEENLDASIAQLMMMVQEVLDGRFDAFSTDVSMGGNTLTDLADATDDGDAVNLKVLKDYVAFVDYASLTAARLAAEAAQVGAETAQLGAETALASAEAVAGDVAISEANAAASALSASQDAAAVASALANIAEDVVSISTNTTLTGTAVGDLYSVDCSASDVVVTLPLAADVGEPWTVRVKKVDGTANKVLVRRQGTDTIDGNTTDFEIKAENGGARFVVDLDKAPDNWESLAFGVAVGDATPVGTIVSFDGPIPPDSGCLLADGSPFTQTSFPDLYSFYEVQGFPHGGGAGTANLPGLMAGIQIGDTKPATAVIYEYTADNVTAGATVSGSWQDRSPSLKEHMDTNNIVAVTGKTFTLQPGTYDLETDTPFATTGGMRTRLYSVTDAAEVVGSVSVTGSAGGTATYYQHERVNAFTTVTLTQATTFKLQYYTQVSSTYGQGFHDNIAMGDELWATIKVTKHQAAAANKTIGIKAYNAVTNQAQVELGQVVQDVAANTAAIAGLQAKTEWPGMYTGTDKDNVDFPIGTLLFTTWGAAAPRNSVVAVYLDQSTSFANNGFTLNSGATQLLGTWVNRGAGPNQTMLVQRIA